MSKRLLLLSGSKYHGNPGYLDHAEREIRDFLGKGTRNVAFIPYARPGGMSHDDYTRVARDRFDRMGYKLVSVHEGEPKDILGSSNVIFVGGGNTFRLLHGIQDNDLTDTVSQGVESGKLYIGASAGSNVACPTIMTTNDMPVREVDSFVAFDLIPFQINPHFIDKDPTSKHQGETREDRINEFHSVVDEVVHPEIGIWDQRFYNMLPVIGLREGTMLHVEGDQMQLLGVRKEEPKGARLFLRGKPPQEYEPGSRLDFLLEDCLERYYEI